MDLTEVLSEIEKMLIRIDNEQDYISNPTNIFIRNNNGRTGDPYFPGLLTLTEDQIVNQMLNQFQNNVSTKITSFRIQFPVGTERIDILLNSSTKSKTSNRKWEWAIEFKKINLIGNN